VPVPGEIELVFRGGPSVTYTDPLQPERAQSRSELLLEMQARWSLLGGIGLEYQGSAVPALTPLDHGRLEQDLGLAVPVGSAGKFRVGAKHRWDATTDTPRSSWVDGMQLYVGVELSR
jgi:hypothetical protein